MKAGSTGFDVRPSRPPLVTAGLLVVVVLGASAFARGFRESSLRTLEFYADSADPTSAARSLSRLEVFAITTSLVLVASILGHIVQRRWGRHVGVEAVASSARGEGRSISFRATVVRVVATWLSSVGLVSIGRESAIIESGGALGSTVARRTGRGDTMAAAGIAAAFAAAYNSPVAAVLYLEEHLGVSRSRRALTFVAIGAIGGHLTAVLLLNGGAIFPPVQGSRWAMLVNALIALVPAVLAARLFLHLRVRVTTASVAQRLRCRQAFVVIALSVIAGGAVAVFPYAAGNGMEALRHASTDATVGLGVALLVGKLVGTTAALGAGAPGGVVTPSVALSSGAALITLRALGELGLTVDHPWDAMVAAMAIGVAVGIRSPLMAIFLIPELLGDYRLVPVIAVVVGAAVLVDRLIDRVVLALGLRTPTGVYDEDA